MAEQNPLILLVDDDITVIQQIAAILQPIASLRFATNGQTALQLATTETPDLILLDADMPAMNGFMVCEQLKKDIYLKDVPVIFVTSHHDEQMEAKGLALGAIDFISKPVRPSILNARVSNHLKLKQALDTLKNLAYHDALTGIANRRVFEENLASQWRNSLRLQQPLSVLMIDVDHFKAFNDSYGHQQGDYALKKIASTLAQNIKRPTDLLARYGGEEFVVLLPDTDEQGMQLVAEQMRLGIEQLAINHGKSPTHDYVTISIGGACVHPAMLTAAQESLQTSGHTELVKVADTNLYQAKQAGRNQSSHSKLDVSDDNNKTNNDLDNNATITAAVEPSALGIAAR